MHLGMTCEARRSNWIFEKLNCQGLRFNYTERIPEYIHLLLVFKQVVNTFDRFRM